MERQDNEVATVSLPALEAALYARRDYIMANLESLDMRTLRGQLEEDMTLARGALKAHRSTVEELVSAMLNEDNAASASPQQHQDVDVDADDDDDDDEAAAAGVDDDDNVGTKQQTDKTSKRKRKERVPKKALKKAAAPRKRHKAAAVKGPKRSEDPQLDHLKAMCKQASIKVPPTLYVKHKSAASLVQALEDLLAAQGLSRVSGPKEVQRVRRRLENEREMDGIDFSNIIGDGTRNRRRAAANVNYRAFADEEEESQSEQSDDGPSQGRERKHQIKAQPVKTEAAPATKPEGKVMKTQSKANDEAEGMDPELLDPDEGETFGEEPKAASKTAKHRAFTLDDSDSE